VSTTRYRLILASLGLLFAFVVVATVLLIPSGESVSLPDPVERISPRDGAIVQRQTSLEIDLAAGYVLRLTVDGVPIPLADIDHTEQTGRYDFRPGAGKAISEWTPGFHVVEISFDKATGLPDPGSLRWSFRIQ